MDSATPVSNGKTTVEASQSTHITREDDCGFNCSSSRGRRLLRPVSHHKQKTTQARTIKEEETRGKATVTHTHTHTHTHRGPKADREEPAYQPATQLTSQPINQLTN